MRIRTQLALTTVVILVAFLTMAAGSAVQQRTLRWLTSGEATAAELLQGAHDLALLSHELLLAPSARIRAQWRASYDAFGEVLARDHGHRGPGWRDYLDDILSEHVALGQAYERVLDAQDMRPAESALGDYPDLSVALMLHSRDLLSLLQELSRTEHTIGLKRTRDLMLVATLVDVLALSAGAVLLWLLWRRLISGMGGLAQGFERVASGELDYRVDTGQRDELGDLARSFDRMTERVAEQTARLRGSEARLAQANLDLEQRVAERTRDLDDAVRQLYQAGEELARSERLATMGRLVGGVSHELNNPLMGALNYVDHVAGKLTDAEQRQWLERASKQINRAVSVVENLVRLGRGGDQHLQSLPVTELVTSVLDLASARLSQVGARVESHLPAGLANVSGQPVGLRQILLHLVLNAADAVAGCDQREIRIGARATGNRVELLVEDSGPGVPEGIRERIFEPFFTTKHLDDEVGLGLALARRLAEASGGTLRFVPTPAGACFELALLAAGADDDIRPSTP